jgi:vacuolar-type H+-ATPase subunit H
MDFYNSYVVPGQRIEKAKENEDTIIALTIAAENCLQMAKKSKNKTVQDAYMEQRKIYREEIRKLGGRSK